MILYTCEVPSESTVRKYTPGFRSPNWFTFTEVEPIEAVLVWLINTLPEISFTFSFTSPAFTLVMFTDTASLNGFGYTPDWSFRFTKATLEYSAVPLFNSLPSLVNVFKR